MGCALFTIIVFLLSISGSSGYYDSIRRRRGDLQPLFDGESASHIQYGKDLVSEHSDKEQLTAFMLSLFCFGAGRVYIEDYIIGCVQLFLLQALVVLMCASFIGSYLF